MTSKKYKLLGAFLLLTLGSFAQVGGSGSVYDSSVIPSKRMPQQNEFWNKTYNFPAKPRNQWEVGVSTGIFTVSGDVAATPFTAPNFSVHVRKAFGYIFSMRLQYMNTVGKGMNWRASNNFVKNEAWNLNLPVGKRYFAPLNLPNSRIFSDGGSATAVSGDQVFYNYKTKVQDLGLQGIVTLNNIRFHKQKTGIVVYGGGGITPDIYVPLDTSMLNPFVTEVYATGMIQEFAYNYYADHKNDFSKYTSIDDFSSKFTVDNTLYTTFVQYCFTHGVNKKTESYVEKSKLFLSTKLKAYLAKQAWKNDGFYKINAQDDKSIQRALHELER